MAVRRDAPPRVSQCWLAIAVLSVGLSAAAALVLVVARTPVVSALVSADTFPRALVVHVNLATLIWYCCMAGALWTETLRPRLRPAAGVLLASAAIAVAGVLAAGLAGAGAPVLANYVPYLDSPWFLGALAAIAAATVLTALLTVHPPRDAAEYGFQFAKWPFLMAALYLAAALAKRHTLVEALWGAGHILQFGFVTLLMAIWLRLAQRAGLATSRITAGLPVAAALPATIAPVALLSGAWPPEALHLLHTELMRWLNWPAALLLALLLLRRGSRAMRVPCLAPSIAMLVLGILAGTAIDRQTTMIPAHYHGTIGAFTLALMTAVMARLGLADGDDRAQSRALRPLHAYAAGSLLLIAGLAWSGWLGAPRKTGFVGAEAEPGMALAAGLVGLGGVVTIAGVTLFASRALPRIIGLCASPRTPPRNAAPTFAAAH